jgi:hypothetical protein
MLMLGQYDQLIERATDTLLQFLSEIFKKYILNLK